METKLAAKIAARNEIEKKIAELDKTFNALQMEYSKKRDALIVDLCKADGAIEVLKDLIHGERKEGKPNESNNG